MDNKQFNEKYQVQVTREATKEYIPVVKEGKLELEVGEEIQGKYLKRYKVQVMDKETNKEDYQFKVMYEEDILFMLEQKYGLTKEREDLSNKKDLVLVRAHAVGYHTNSEYKEDVVITKKLYDMAKETVDNYTHYVGDLDGKHSEVPADITIQVVSEQELSEIKLEEGDNFVAEHLSWKIMDSAGVSMEENNKDYDYVQKVLKKL